MTTLYADDPDAHVDYEMAGADLVFAPSVTTAAGAVTAEWLAAATDGKRTLRVHVSGLPKGNHGLRLVVPGGNDANLGIVTLL